MEIHTQAVGPDKATVVLLPFSTKSQRAQSPRRSWLSHPEEGKKRLPMLAVPKLLSCHPGRRLGVKGVGREPGKVHPAGCPSEMPSPDLHIKRDIRNKSLSTGPSSALCVSRQVTASLEKLGSMMSVCSQAVSVTMGQGYRGAWSKCSTSKNTW